MLDIARARGFLVDFPEEAESNRVAGEARMKAYLERLNRACVSL